MSSADQERLREISCWMLNAANVIDQNALDTPPAVPLLRCAVRMALQAARLQRVADNRYHDPSIPLRKARRPTRRGGRTRLQVRLAFRSPDFAFATFARS